MDLQATTIDRHTAREKFLEYRDAVRARHNEEDAQIMRGYRTIAAGQQVISLTATLRAGGRDAKGLPNLAVARADTERCWLEHCDYAGAVRYVTRQDRAANNRRDVREFPTGTLPALDLPNPAPQYLNEGSNVQGVTMTRRWQTRAVYAIVPNVPPSLRPAHSLAGYDILWEVDEWKLDPAPPVDPALLKHIGGDLYAVCAVWDLTDLERLVLQGRA